MGDLLLPGVHGGLLEDGGLQPQPVQGHFDGGQRALAQHILLAAPDEQRAAAHDAQEGHCEDGDRKEEEEEEEDVVRRRQHESAREAQSRLGTNVCACMRVCVSLNSPSSCDQLVWCSPLQLCSPSAVR